MDVFQGKDLLISIFYWLVEGWSLILAEPEPTRTHPNPPTPKPDPGDIIFSELTRYQIKIKMLKPSEEPAASSKAPNEDLKDMSVLCTFRIKIGSQNLDHGYIKDQW